MPDMSNPDTTSSGNAGVDPGKQRRPLFQQPKVIIASIIILPVVIGLTAFFAARAWTREGR
jgi:hypothetical protein